MYSKSTGASSPLHNGHVHCCSQPAHTGVCQGHKSILAKTLYLQGWKYNSVEEEKVYKYIHLANVWIYFHWVDTMLHFSYALTCTQLAVKELILLISFCWCSLVKVAYNNFIFKFPCNIHYILCSHIISMLFCTVTCNYSWKINEMNKKIQYYHLEVQSTKSE